MFGSTLLTRLMDGADGFITQHTGRDFTGGTLTELHAAGRGVLFLRNFPVTSVTSVKVDPARQFGSETVRARPGAAVDYRTGLSAHVADVWYQAADWPELSAAHTAVLALAEAELKWGS